MTTLSELTARLRELASKATPGPWASLGYPYYEYWILEKHEADQPAPSQVHPIATVEKAPGRYVDGWYKNTQRAANAAHITACDPVNITRILDALASAQAVVEAARYLSRDSEGWLDLDEWLDFDKRIAAYDLITGDEKSPSQVCKYCGVDQASLPWPVCHNEEYRRECQNEGHVTQYSNGES